VRKQIFLREISFFDREIDFFDEKIAFLRTQHQYTLKFVRQNFPNRRAHRAGRWKIATEALYARRFALSLEGLARSHNPPKKLIRNQALSAGSDSDTTY